MGGTRWSDDDYKDRATVRATTGAPTFKHDDDVRTGKAATALHDCMNPKRRNKFDKNLRDARDTDVHPTSRAVAVLFDVTGSMGEVPVILQRNLPKLMGLVMRKGYLEHPAILVGAIGDATCDRVPLQVGNFESGIEIENDLTNIFLEGAGGGHITESYELAMYYMARHTALDCLEKRGEKGYLFIIGDETPYPKVNKEQVGDIIGDKLEADIDTSVIVKELQDMYETYYILPHMTSNWQNPHVLKTWARYFAQHILHLEDPNAIYELIAATIGLCEGFDIENVATDLASVGTTSKTIGDLRKALVPVKAKGRSSISVSDSGKPSGVETV